MAAESRLDVRSFVGPPKKLLKRRYDDEHCFRSAARKRNRFSWLDVDGARIPYIYRGDRKYVLVSVINDQLLAGYPRWYPEEVRSCPPLLSCGVTAEEADMLNQMEKRIFGDLGGPFVVGDLIVELDAALGFYSALRDHYKRLGSGQPQPDAGAASAGSAPALAAPALAAPSSRQPDTPVDVNEVWRESAEVRPNLRSYVPGYSVGFMDVIPDGWILINNAVVPCIRRVTADGQTKLLPLPVVEEGVGELAGVGDVGSLPVECFVLSAMCRAVGHQFMFPVGLRLVPLNAVLESGADLLVHRLSDQNPFQCASDIINRRARKATFDGPATTTTTAPSGGGVATDGVPPRPAAVGGSVGTPADPPPADKPGRAPDENAHSKDGYSDEVLDLSTRGKSSAKVSEWKSRLQGSVDGRSNGAVQADVRTAAERVHLAVERVVRHMKAAEALANSAGGALAEPANGFIHRPPPTQAGADVSATASVTVKQPDVGLANNRPQATGLQEGQLMPAANATGNAAAANAVTALLQENGKGQATPVWNGQPAAAGLLPLAERRRKTVGDEGQMRVKRRARRERAKQIAACLGKQNGRRPGELGQRMANSAAKPRPLKELAFEVCARVYGKSPVPVGGPPNSNLMKDRLKRLLLTRRKAQRDGQDNGAQAGDEKRTAPSRIRRYTARGSSTHRLAKATARGAVPTSVDGRTDRRSAAPPGKEAPSSANGGAVDQGPSGRRRHAARRSKQSATGCTALESSRTRRIPTLDELVEEINRPPLKYKRKCPFADSGSLPKLPFLGLAGPHTWNWEEDETSKEHPGSSRAPDRLPSAQRRTFSPACSLPLATGSTSAQGRPLPETCLAAVQTGRNVTDMGTSTESGAVGKQGASTAFVRTAGSDSGRGSGSSDTELMKVQAEGEGDADRKRGDTVASGSEEVDSRSGLADGAADPERASSSFGASEQNDRLRPGGSDVTDHVSVPSNDVTTQQAVQGHAEDGSATPRSHRNTSIPEEDANGVRGSPQTTSEPVNDATFRASDRSRSARTFFDVPVPSDGVDHPRAAAVPARRPVDDMEVPQGHKDSASVRTSQNVEPVNKTPAFTGETNHIPDTAVRRGADVGVEFTDEVHAREKPVLVIGPVSDVAADLRNHGRKTAGRSKDVELESLERREDRSGREGPDSVQDSTDPGNSNEVAHWQSGKSSVLLISNNEQVPRRVGTESGAVKNHRQSSAVFDNPKETVPQQPGKALVALENRKSGAAVDETKSRSS